jgi:hypothetical protein
MDIAKKGQFISTSQSIAQLGLPAGQKRKALETLALVDALISPFFADTATIAAAKKSPAIKPVLKAQ